MLKKMILALAAAFVDAHACPITPLETLNRPMLKGPLMTKTLSHQAQWNGLTTLASGSATGVASTTIVGSDSWINLSIKAVLPANYVTSGLVSAVSGANTKTVSTVAVTSGDAILVTPRFADVASGFGRVIKVNSIVDGVSFNIETADGIGPGGTSVYAWKILGKDPSDIFVNTIVDGSYFAFGWADGVARNYDAVVMWEVRPTR